MSKFLNARTALAGFVAAAAVSAGAQADQVFADDVIVQGSLCVGQDCVNNENFGFDTIRIKENNTRIAFVDTSTTSSFPSVDWELQANESTNGGANRFAFLDRTNGRTIFVMEAAAPNNSLYIDDSGNIGLGTSTPVLPLHVRDGNSPGLRLEQDGSSGFTAQTWDIAGNEANFFVRDVTNGSRLPFKIQPGAPNNALYVASDGDIGLGTQSPGADFHVERAAGDVLIGPDANLADLFINASDGRADIWMNTTTSTAPVKLELSGDVFSLSFDATGAPEMSLSRDGDLTLRRNLSVGGTITSGLPGGACEAGCDEVFFPDYELNSIEEHGRLMLANRHLPAVGPTYEGQQIDVMVRMARMLNELETAHLYIQQLNNRIDVLEQSSTEYSVSEG